MTWDKRPSTGGWALPTGGPSERIADYHVTVRGVQALVPGGIIHSYKKDSFTDTDEGFWLGVDEDGITKFAIGDGTSYLKWDGTTLTVAGDGSGVTSIDGANIQTGTVTATQIAANTITAAEIAASTITGTQIAATTISGTHIEANTIDAGHLNVSSLSAITVNTGSLTVDGTFTVSTGGSISVNSGDTLLDENGLTLKPGTAVTNKVQWVDGAATLSSLEADVDSGVGATIDWAVKGKDATSPEAAIDIVASTYDGAAHSGVASIGILLETENGTIWLSNNTVFDLGSSYIQGQEISDPGNAGLNHGRIYFRDNGSGKTQLVVVFNSGAVQVLATQP